MNLKQTHEERISENSRGITQEQVTQAMSDILFQRLSQSEVELMKIENAQLKQTLADFTSNYNKFEDLIKNIIQKNNENLMKNVNEQNRELEKKLNALQESNTILSRNISTAVGNVSENLIQITNKTSTKMSESVSKATKSLEGSVNTIGKKITSFWEFSTFQTCLFWSAMLGLIFLLVKPMCEVYEIAVPVLLWKIAYPVALAPVIIFLAGTVLQSILEKVKD